LVAGVAISIGKTSAQPVGGTLLQHQADRYRPWGAIILGRAAGAAARGTPDYHLEEEAAKLAAPAQELHFTGRGLLRLFGLEYRGDALGIGSQRRDSGALDL
jgi:hypothetical protein